MLKTKDRNFVEKKSIFINCLHYIGFLLDENMGLILKTAVLAIKYNCNDCQSPIHVNIDNNKIHKGGLFFLYSSAFTLYIVISKISRFIHLVP